MDIDPIILNGSYREVRNYFRSYLPPSEDLFQRDECGHFISQIIKEVKTRITREQNPRLKNRYEKRLKDIKTILNDLTGASKNGNWYDALLRSSGQRTIWKNKIEIAHIKDTDSSHSIVEPVSTEDGRFFKDEVFSSSHVACWRGSTFISNRPGFMHEESKVLDHAFAAYNYSQERIIGFTLAIGDGCGGHFGDPWQDETISRASWYAAKHAVRLFSAHNNPDEILQNQNIGQILQSIRGELYCKAALGEMTPEKTTLAVARAFLEGDSLHIVGFNIGDSMLFGWDPVSKRAFDIAPSHVSDAGTAMVPEPFKPFEVYVIDTNRMGVQIPATTILFGITDGVYDDLPLVVNESTYENSLLYREKTINHDFLEGYLSVAKSPDEIAELLLQKALNETDRLRDEGIMNNKIFQEGDDVCIIGMELPHLEDTDFEQITPEEYEDITEPHGFVDRFVQSVQNDSNPISRHTWPHR